MIPLLLILVSLAQFVHGVQTDSTMTGIPQPSGDGTPRTILGILGSCAATLLICIWRALHFDIYYIDSNSTPYNGPVGLVLWAIFAPEIVVMSAVVQWWRARSDVSHFRARGYHWSMTHSFFALIGGFAYHDENGEERGIGSIDFLRLCIENKIANPFIRVREIRDRSKSDALVKAILAMQLLWFVIQVIARGYSGLAITLLEIDTVSMAALALLILWFWWDKPHCPRCPHMFYSPQVVKPNPRMANLMKGTWRPEPGYLSTILSWFSRVCKTQPATAEHDITLINGQEGPVCTIIDRLSHRVEINDVGCFSLFTTWLILGGLHLIAWDFHFPTETEKILWRVASLVLTGGSIIFLVSFRVFDRPSGARKMVALFEWILAISGILGVVTRVLLIALMFASLRALPPSAYETVAWTSYIPHL